jgi:uncharacterized membrane protein YhaH (DUF805 family)
MTDNADATPMSQILTYRGRATRGQFWIGMLMMVVALVFAMIYFAPYFTTTGAGYGSMSKLFVFLLLCGAIWFHSAFHIARLRDRGRPAWWYLIYGFGPVVLFSLARMTQGNISNQPAMISIVADLGTLALILLALADLGIGKSAGAATPRNGR